MEVLAGGWFGGRELLSKKLPFSKVFHLERSSSYETHFCDQPRGRKRKLL